MKPALLKYVTLTLTFVVGISQNCACGALAAEESSKSLSQQIIACADSEELPDLFSDYLFELNAEGVSSEQQLKALQTTTELSSRDSWESQWKRPNIEQLSEVLKTFKVSDVGTLTALDSFLKLLAWPAP